MKADKYEKISSHINLEWLVPGKVAMFRSHARPYEDKPAPIDGACVVHVYSPTSCEIKGMVSGGMGAGKMVTGYKAIVRAMAERGYTGVKLEIFDESGNSAVWIDGKRH